MNKNIFQSKKEASEHAAYRVAKFWLEFAEDVIARNLTPLKLSEDAVRLVREEMDRDIYNWFRYCMKSDLIALMAVDMAREEIRQGLWPSVELFFLRK